MNEIFKDILGFEGLYQVSNLGRVKSLGRTRICKGGGIGIVKEKILKTNKNKKDGYLFVELYKDGKAYPKTLHRLVAQAFIDNPNNLPCINHINEVKTDNRVENLEWCDVTYNNNYGTRIERYAKANTNGKLSKAVLQYSLDGTFIQEFPSGREVQRKLGFAQQHIAENCRGERTTAYGFIWKYKNDSITLPKPKKK